MEIRELSATRPTLEEVRRSWAPTVSLATAATVFGISRATAYNLYNQGSFPAQVVQVGGRRHVLTSSIIRVLEGDHLRDGAA